MTTELTLLGWTLVLALVQIILPAMVRNKEVGLAHNAGPRDEETVPVGKVTGRLKRAQANLFETLPLFAAAILIAHAAGREDSLTLDGAWLYLISRIVYVPLYAFGVPYVRTLAWGVGLGGLILIIIQDLSPA
jgi:uncharacterized MAPEG superfamily protein